MNKIIATLCFPMTETNILLGLKKRGLGEGKWNGFGGKVERNESIETAARREVREECGLEVIEMQQRGTIEFHYLSEDILIEGHIFAVSAWKGEIAESEEMKPQWFSLQGIPYKEMWPTDIHWLPVFLRSRNFNAKLIFENYGTLREWELTQA